MGSIRKAFTWGRKKPDVSEMLSRLRILVRQLERERNKMEKEARDAKARAVKARKTSNREAYQMYATEMVRLRRSTLVLDKTRLRILRIISHVQRAQTTAKVSMAVGQVAEIMKMLGDATETPKVIDHLDEISRRLEEFEIESGIVGEAFEVTSDSRVSSEDLTAAMAEIDAEAGVATAVSPTHVVISESDKLEDEIRALEEELGK
ncbi:MAG: SNF7 family protein [Candidatus Thorarchaeota archaeon]|nr:SNF7 family protein [Candidatus Thorarchaeota archaeon]